MMDKMMYNLYAEIEKCLEQYVKYISFTKDISYDEAVDYFAKNCYIAIQDEHDVRADPLDGWKLYLYIYTREEENDEEIKVVKYPIY